MSKIVSKENKLCMCCMKEHEVKTVRIIDDNIYKGVDIKYPAFYYYCENADEYYNDENQLSENDLSMKNEYRKKVGLLTSKEIISIREKYNISQTDLCILLGWGGKTITRYEGHQVQDMAHDSILRKIRDDAEWFLNLLEKSKDMISEDYYVRYRDNAAMVLENERDTYLKKAIISNYAAYFYKPYYSGNRMLSLETVVDVINYIVNENKEKEFFMSRMLKLLWYIDTLSFKKRGHSITGLIYQVRPNGILPILYECLIDLDGISYEEIEIGEGIGYKLISTGFKEYNNLTKDDKKIIDKILSTFKNMSNELLLKRIKEEPAYKGTNIRDIVSFKQSENLSVN